tara:strand:- start:1088 stop:2056 length:969 start_codon:yes stop_codon:yes gene_type:complete
MVNGYGGIVSSHDSRRSPKARDTRAFDAVAPTDDASRGDADERDNDRATTTTMTVTISATMTTTRRARTGASAVGTMARGKTATTMNATTTRAVRARASGDGARDDDGDGDDDDDARMDREAAEEARRRAEGDAYVQDKLERELRLRGKIYRAEAELDTKKEEIMDMGEQSKGNIDVEAGLMRDRTSLELGMVAGELDAELAALADDAQAARERNAKVKREIEDLAEELLGTGKRVEKDAKPPPGSLSEMKMKAANAEAEAVDKRMKATLEETQRATTYTMVLLLLGFLGVTLAAEGSYDKLAAVVGVFALVGYQSRMEARK